MNRYVRVLVAGSRRGGKSSLIRSLAPPLLHGELHDEAPIWMGEVGLGQHGLCRLRCQEVPGPLTERQDQARAALRRGVDHLVLVLGPRSIAMPQRPRSTEMLEAVGQLVRECAEGSPHASISLVLGRAEDHGFRYPCMGRVWSTELESTDLATLARSARLARGTPKEHVHLRRLLMNSAPLWARTGGGGIRFGAQLNTYLVSAEPHGSMPWRAAAPGVAELFMDLFHRVKASSGWRFWPTR